MDSQCSRPLDHCIPVFGIRRDSSYDLLAVDDNSIFSQIFVAVVVTRDPAIAGSLCRAGNLDHRTFDADIQFEFLWRRSHSAGRVAFFCFRHGLISPVYAGDVRFRRHILRSFAYDSAAPRVRDLPAIQSSCKSNLIWSIIPRVSPRPFQRMGCFGALVFSLVLLLAVTALLAPWAYHAGGRWTPGMWWGFGMLRTTAGDEYPLFVYFFPNFRSMSQLRLNGQRSSSGLHGGGWLCSAQGVTQRLDLSGDIYGTYLTTDGNQLAFRLLDARRVSINAQNRRYFDLLGRWHGPELAMQDNGAWVRSFHPDPQNPKERADVTFTWGSYWDFKKLCNATAIPEKARIPPPRY